MASRTAAPNHTVRPETKKRPGVFYAFTRDGVPLVKLPKPLREIALRFLLRQSVLAQGIDKARGSFMSGMQTYWLKLGPQMLGSAYTKPIDRQIATALPSFCVRLRL